jgi:hypothetical protein
MVGSVDTSVWNLFRGGAWSIGVAAAAIACGPVLDVPQDDDGGSGDSGDTTGDSGSTSPTDDPTDDPTQGECVQDSECPSGYSCINNFCQYDCYCGCGVEPPPQNDLRCSDVGPWYECYSDDGCGDGEICIYGYCAPDPLDCSSFPIAATSIPLAFSPSEAPVVQLQFTDARPGVGAEVYVARGNAIESVLPSGEPGPSVTTAGDVLAFAIGDLDGDGIADLVTAEDGDGASIRLWQGSDAGFTPTEIAQPLIGARALFIADREGDGEVDVYAHVGRDLLVFPTAAGLPLGPAVPLLEQTLDAAIPLDVGSDGRTEVLFTNAGFSLLAEHADPSVQPLYESAGELVGPLVIGDFDGDQATDAVGFLGTEQVTFLADVGNAPSFAEAVVQPVAAASGDIDGDGRSDLALLLPSGGGVLVRYGTTSGSRKGLQLPLRCDTSYEIDGVTGQRLASGDFDGDGRAELAVGDAAGIVLLRF